MVIWVHSGEKKGYFKERSKSRKFGGMRLAFFPPCLPLQAPAKLSAWVWFLVSSRLPGEPVQSRIEGAHMEGPAGRGGP